MMAVNAVPGCLLTVAILTGPVLSRDFRNVATQESNVPENICKRVEVGSFIFISLLANPFDLKSFNAENICE